MSWEITKIDEKRGRIEIVETLGPPGAQRITSVDIRLDTLVTSQTKKLGTTPTANVTMAHKSIRITRYTILRPPTDPSTIII
jgi:hypothetical protein